jgi:hypothetical protein
LHLYPIRELDHDENAPSIKDLINHPCEEKAKVLQHMKQGAIIAAAPVIVVDILNPDIHLPHLYLMSDGKYGWRSDIIYYLEVYDLLLPEEFVKHAVNFKITRDYYLWRKEVEGRSS